MSVHQIETAEVFTPLLEPARYKGAHGGRGSGKSHFFADEGVEDALCWPGDHGEGLRWVCIREIQKSLKDSAKYLVESKLKALSGGAEANGFKIYNDRISTPGDGVILFQGMQDHTAESIKSLEGFHIAWAEEAQTLSAHSLTLLRPTIRWESARTGAVSELRFSWNPRRKTDAVDALLRGKGRPASAAVVQANWYDNPWFPGVLEQERLEDLAKRPEQYPHIWEGAYAAVFEGAYYTKQLIAAKKENRIGRVAADPLMQYRAFWDIGTNDATAIWVAQFVGREIRVLDYYEASGQPLGAHLNWLRENGYEGCLCVLPHDGGNVNHITAEKFATHIESAGFPTKTIANQGKGAAMKRVEAARRRFPLIWFNEDTTEAGREALAAYHEKKDEARNIGLGPEHDWSSHGADAFGLMCSAYEPPETGTGESFYSGGGGRSAGWMGG